MAAATNLFNDDISLLQASVYFSPNLKWEQVSASVKMAERTYLRDTFGSYYTALLTAIGEDSLTEAQVLLLDEMRLASANLAWMLYAPKHNVNITSTGFKQSHNDNEKPAFQWAVKDAIKHFSSAGFMAIENTFEFLEANAGDYNYESSSVYKAAKGYFIDSAKAFQLEVNIMRSRYLYLELLPEMRAVERDVVKPILGTEAFDTLKKKLQKDNGEDNTLSDAEKAQLEIIRPLVAYKTVENSVAQRMMLFNEHGLLVPNTSFSGSENAMQPAELDKIVKFELEMSGKAAAKINELDTLVNPVETDEEVDDINLLDPDDKLGSFY